MKQETISKYTEKLPEGWKWVKFNEVAEMKGRIGWRGLSTSDYTSEGPILLSVNNITEDFKLDLTNATHITQKSYDDSPEIMIKKGDVLLSKSGTIGRTCIVEEVKEPMTVNAAINVIRVKENLLKNKYLMYFYASSLGQKIFSKLAVGMAQKNMFQRDLNIMPILLPPLKNQQVITNEIENRMSKLDELKKVSFDTMEAVDDLFNSYLKYSFEEQKMKKYPTIKLKDETNKIGSGITPAGGHTVYIKEGIPLIRSMNVHLNEFKMDGLAHITVEIDESMKSTRVMKGDVLLNITGASIGRVCVVPLDMVPANVNQHVSIIRVKERINPYYLSYYLSNPIFQRFIMSSESGATRQALTKDKIENFDIPCPPRAIQDKLVSELNTKKQICKNMRSDIKIQFNSISEFPYVLLNKIFGKYDIPEEVE